MTRAKPSDWQQLPLWPHQVAAVGMCRGYLDDCDADPTRSDAALVRMPTGTGKSGVIATVVRCFNDGRDWLVLTPSIALRKQLSDDIKQDFWGAKGINVDPSAWPLAVEVFKPSNAASIFGKAPGTRAVFICTIQTLETIRAKHPLVYDQIAKRVKAVIFDEGHREPAIEWSEAVRGLKQPTILFTATPYRNDFKLFNVESAVYSFSHRQAEDQRYVREVRFVESRFTSAAEFVVELMAERARLPAGSRVIVRCADKADVDLIANQLKAKKQDVIAIHDTFEDEADDSPVVRHRRVPSPQTNDAEYWVHQFKLTEGIDDASFRLLGIYQPFSNSRSLIQQIGRVIRNPGQKTGQYAVVLSHVSAQQESIWKGYRAHEEAFEKDPELYEARQVFDTSTLAQPELIYSRGSYRRRFTFDGPDFHQRVRLVPAAHVFVDKPAVQMSTLAAEVEKDWRTRDLDVRKVVNIDAATTLLAYVEFELSPVLEREALLEFRLGCTVLHRQGGFLFVGDSRGAMPQFARDQFELVPTGSLVRLFSGRRRRSLRSA